MFHLKHPLSKNWWQPMYKFRSLRPIRSCPRSRKGRAMLSSRCWQKIQPTASSATMSLQWNSRQLELTCSSSNTTSKRLKAKASKPKRAGGEGEERLAYFFGDFFVPAFSDFGPKLTLEASIFPPSIGFA